jgi:hypothetical protein
MRETILEGMTEEVRIEGIVLEDLEAEIEEGIEMIEGPIDMIEMIEMIDMIEVIEVIEDLERELLDVTTVNKMDI